MEMKNNLLTKKDITLIQESNATKLARRANNVKLKKGKTI